MYIWLLRSSICEMLKSKESDKQVSWLWEPAVIIFYGFMKKRVWLAIVGVVVLCIGICYYMFFGRYSWSLSDDGKLTIPGLDRPDYLDARPWLAQRGKIKEVVIKDGVTSIGDYAFDGCSRLRSITIPNSVTSIEHGAFEDCSNLRSITCTARIPPGRSKGDEILGTIGLAGVNKFIPVYVPAESVEAYKKAEVWKEFYNIKAIK